MKNIIRVLLIILFLISACGSRHKIDGWYPVADYPDNTVVGKPLATVRDFDVITLERVTQIVEGDTVKQVLIYGKVKPEMKRSWADGTERLIGHRLGFIYNDSVIMAPNINVRIESGSFEISSPDSTLIKRIYNSIKSVR